MALKDIIRTIQSEAKTEVTAIKKEAELKVAQIKSEADEKLSAQRKLLEERADKEAQKVIEKAKFEANIAERNKIVSTKQKVVDKVFEEALDRMKNFDDKQYQEFVTRLIAQLPEIEGGEIVPVKGREKIVGEALKKSGKKIVLSKDTIDGIGGFVYKSSDIEVNDRFEVLLYGVRGDVEIEVSNKLFS